MNYASVLSRRANQLRNNPTKAEIRMMEILKSMEVFYRFQSPRWHGNCRRVFDFWIPQPHRICIEVDGKYHSAVKDKVKDFYLSKARPSYRILRFTNEEVLNNSYYVEGSIRMALKASPIKAAASLGQRITSAL